MSSFLNFEMFGMFKEAKQRDEDPPSKRARLMPTDQNEQQEEKIMAKNQEEKPEKKSIFLPTECWVDTLKLFSRRHLIRRVQPISCRLRDICELHVDTRHEFQHFGLFLQFLIAKMPPNQPRRDQISEMLARHYAIGPCVSRLKIGHTGMGRRQREYNKRRNFMLDILCNCPNLFRNCHLELKFLDKSQISQTTTEYLDQLHQCMRPFCIRFASKLAPSDELLQHSLLLDTPRLKIYLYEWNANVVPTPTSADADVICQWLHLQLMPSADGTIRVLHFDFASNRQNYTGTIVENCKQFFGQAKTADDRRSFLFMFNCRDPQPVQFEQYNVGTGELLKLELHNMGPSYRRIYILHRCLATDLATAHYEFYRETLEQMVGPFHGKPMKNGKQMPILEIH